MFKSVDIVQKLKTKAACFMCYLQTSIEIKGKQTTLQNDCFTRPHATSLSHILTDAKKKNNNKCKQTISDSK